MTEFKAMKTGWILAVLATAAAHDRSWMQFPLLLFAVMIPAWYYLRRGWKRRRKVAREEAIIEIAKPLYFRDGSDYESGLWVALGKLVPDLDEQLENEDENVVLRRLAGFNEEDD